jgi:oxygen-independent coproporphyrinogen-3 oxidase
VHGLSGRDQRNAEEVVLIRPDFLVLKKNIISRILLDNPPGLYVHIPFCLSKCPYCDFYSQTDLTLVPRWLAALEKEIAHYQNQFFVFDTLYLGGGSPSTLLEDELGRLLEALFSRFKFEVKTEMTFEANPNDLNPAKLKRLSQLGINRISLGVQSFDDQELVFLKRRHTAGGAEAVLAWIREAGFDNLGIDLLYGLPGQTTQQWLATLEKTLTFSPEHLSCYQLTLAKGTFFWGLKEKGHLQPINEEEERDFFITTSRFLEDHGYIHYEISNFAREEIYLSKHNQKYWRREPYLGLGPSAHSFQENRRWWNFRSLHKYCQALEQDEVPIEGQEELNAEQIRLETISLGLRTKAGLDLSDLGDAPDLEKKINRLVESGWAMIENNRLSPTIEGFLVADQLPLLF